MAGRRNVGLKLWFFVFKWVFMVLVESSYCKKPEKEPIFHEHDMTKCEVCNFHPYASMMTKNKIIKYECTGSDCEECYPKRKDGDSKQSSVQKEEVSAAMPAAQSKSSRRKMRKKGKNSAVADTNAAEIEPKELQNEKSGGNSGEEEKTVKNCGKYGKVEDGCAANEVSRLEALSKEKIKNQTSTEFKSKSNKN
ncbi:hypothetical protein EDEG_01486, partial [Edhazardia aedis USNM 41457]